MRGQGGSSRPRPGPTLSFGRWDAAEATGERREGARATRRGDALSVLRLEEPVDEEHESHLEEDEEEGSSHEAHGDGSRRSSFKVPPSSTCWLSMPLRGPTRSATPSRAETPRVQWPRWASEVGVRRASRSVAQRACPESTEGPSSTRGRPDLSSLASLGNQPRDRLWVTTTFLGHTSARRAPHTPCTRASTPPRNSRLSFSPSRARRSPPRTSNAPSPRVASSRRRPSRVSEPPFSPLRP